MAISDDCEGICTFSGEAPKGNSSGLLMSLSYLTCGLVLAVSNCVDEVLATEPPSVGRHNGDIVCWQAREPQEKIGWLFPFGILLVIVLVFIL